MAETTTKAAPTQHTEWVAAARRRFGDDAKQWRFVCPVCGGSQSIADFLALPLESQPNGDLGSVVAFSCIGRWMPNAPAAFGGKPTPDTHCNYTLGGLFAVGGVEVEYEGAVHRCFEFADPARGATSEEGR